MEIADTLKPQTPWKIETFLAASKRANWIASSRFVLEAAPPMRISFPFLGLVSQKSGFSAKDPFERPLFETKALLSGTASSLKETQEINNKKKTNKDKNFNTSTSGASKSYPCPRNQGQDKL
jgi:hypothetical protein